MPVITIHHRIHVEQVPISDTIHQTPVDGPTVITVPPGQSLRLLYTSETGSRSAYLITNHHAVHEYSLLGMALPAIERNGGWDCPTVQRHVAV